MEMLTFLSITTISILTVLGLYDGLVRTCIQYIFGQIILSKNPRNGRLSLYSGYSSRRDIIFLLCSLLGAQDFMKYYLEVHLRCLLKGIPSET